MCYNSDGHNKTTLPEGIIACSCNAVHPTVCVRLTWYIHQGSDCHEGMMNNISRPCSLVLLSNGYSDSYLLVPFYPLYTGGCVVLKIGMWL